MPKPSGAEVFTQKNVRFYVQPGGPLPGNELKYSGVDGAYMNIESADNPRLGGISPINVHDPRRIGRYRQVGRSNDAPDFPTWTVQFLQSTNQLPRHLTTLEDCIANYYQVVGNCKDLSDFLRGWNGYIKIYSQGEVTSKSEAGGSWDSDEQLQDDLEYTGTAIYNIGKMGFGEKASVEVYSEVIDIVYGSEVQCEGCGPANNGTKHIYAVANNTVASTGQAPSVFYTLDGGANWTEIAITGSASTDVPRAIDVVGQYLVVLFDDGFTGGYFYAEINSITGIPGAFAKVTTGFTAGFAPTDMYVASAREVWISAENGYIYKVTNITSGATVKDAAAATSSTLNRIDGLEEVIVAVGESGTVVYSITRGETWSTVDVAPSVNGLDSLEVRDDYLWLVGDDAGDVFKSDTQGATAWSEIVIDANATAVQDIYFATEEVGYVVYITAGPVANIATTFNGGEDWTSSTPRINGFPTADRANRLAAPEVPNLNVAANNLAVAGLAGNGSDGLLLVATAAVK